MKPWREIAVPHTDVLTGTLLDAEFAADLSSVHKKTAHSFYQDARTFFERTFITEGMRLLLTQVAERLNGQGGEPIIQLQTSFGGGKTHTLLAVYHLASRDCVLHDLPGIPSLLKQASLMDVPKARVVVLEGNALSPGQPWQHGNLEVKTLWGEFAYQLGELEAYNKVRASDESGTSPGKEILKNLLIEASPCVILVDELVAYIRQFQDGKVLSGGSYDSNLSFVQALTEAVKMVPQAVLLASLPESEIEVGSSVGVAALRALEKLFGRVQALWKPVGIEESFEIVRRRLFEPIRDEVERDAVCAAFMALYKSEGAKFPSETQEARYQRRLQRAYPIHPEVFDRLYEDWSTLDSFQRTRGVLKLMAKVIFRLWKDQNQDLMLMPGSVPLQDSIARNELTYHLGAGWDAVLDKDVDGDRSEATYLDNEPRFGTHQVARRVARTVFLGSAPAAVALRPGITRGIERGRILLGCVQPGQSSATFSDALNRLVDRLHYLNVTGDKTQDGTRFWFDTRANLRREMEDRKGRFDARGEVRGKVGEILNKLVSKGLFDGTHIFTPHSDVPDDASLRLVVLSPDVPYSRQSFQVATDIVIEFVRSNGTKPRFKSNRLVFLAPDAASLGRLIDTTRTALAWASIVKDIHDGRLNIDRIQADQATKESTTAEAVVQRATRDCYKWVLCPMMQVPTDREAQVEAFPMNAGNGAFTDELSRVCTENELIIGTWSPIHLRSRLQELYWKDGRVAVRALAVWDDMLKYLYLPRMKNRSVFDQAIKMGTVSRDFFGTAYGEKEGGFEGFKWGDSNIQIDDTLLLIAPGAAKDFAEKVRQEEEARAAEAARVAAEKAAKELALKGGAGPSGVNGGELSIPGGGGATIDGSKGRIGPVVGPGLPVVVAPKTTTFFAKIEIPVASAGMRLVVIDEEILRVLAGDPNANITVTLEINAEYAKGVPDNIKRAVSENAKQLGIKDQGWE